MKKIWNRLIALLVVLSMLFGFCAIASAAETTTPKTPLVALGDSISTGFALANYNPADLTKATESYVNLLGVGMGITPINLAKDGLTSAELLVQLDKDEVKQQLSNTDVITVSIGGNNVLKPMIGALKKEFGLTETDASELLNDQFIEFGFAGSIPKIQAAIANAKPVVDLGVKAFETEFPAIISKLVAIAPDAKILVSNLYNPYAGINFAGIDLDGATKGPLDSMNQTINATYEATKLNGDFTIMDVKTAFGEKPSVPKYVNVSMQPLNVDPHPSAAGHEVIFQLYGKALIKNFTPFGFTDISKHKAKDSIRYLAGQGIIGGIGNGKFAPDANLKRSEFVKILYGSVEGIPAVKASTFVDVPRAMWFAKYVDWAVEKGVTSGYAMNQFKPDNHVTRQELARMLHQYLVNINYPVPTNTTVGLYADDARIANWAKEDVYALKAYGFLIEKTGEKFNPTAPATRGETTMILANFVKKFREQ